MFNILKVSLKDFETLLDIEVPYIENAMKEVSELEEILKSELEKHFSSSVNIRTFEDVTVQMDDGKVNILIHQLIEILKKSFNVSIREPKI